VFKKFLPEMPGQKQDDISYAYNSLPTIHKIRHENTGVVDELHHTPMAEDATVQLREISPRELHQAVPGFRIPFGRIFDFSYNYLLFL